jgi:hypothetical protein
MPRKSAAKPAATAPVAPPEFAVVKVGAKRWQLTINGTPEGEPYALRRDAVEAQRMAEADYTPPAEPVTSDGTPVTEAVAAAVAEATAPKGVNPSDMFTEASLDAAWEAMWSPDAIAAMTPLDRLAAAKIEAAAKKGAKAGGWPQPRTPVLDWMANPANANRRRAKAGGAGAAKVRLADTEVRAWIDAKRAEGVDAGPGKLLALFRSSGLSCSQERFRAIVAGGAS